MTEFGECEKSADALWIRNSSQPHSAVGLGLGHGRQGEQAISVEW